MEVHALPAGSFVSSEHPANAAIVNAAKKTKEVRGEEKRAFRYNMCTRTLMPRPRLRKFTDARQKDAHLMDENLPANRLGLGAVKASAAQHLSFGSAGRLQHDTQQQHFDFSDEIEPRCASWLSDV